VDVGDADEVRDAVDAAAARNATLIGPDRPPPHRGHGRGHPDVKHDDAAAGGAAPCCVIHGLNAAS